MRRSQRYIAMHMYDPRYHPRHAETMDHSHVPENELFLADHKRVAEQVREECGNSSNDRVLQPGGHVQEQIQRY